MVEFIKALASILLFVGVGAFITFSLILHKLNRQLINLGTYSSLISEMNSVAVQHDNYLTFMQKRHVNPDSIDQDVYMSIYLLGKYDGLSLAFQKNKIEVEKILQKNLDE